MANHSLEAFSGGRYNPAPDAARNPNFDYVFAAEQRKNPTEGLVRKLGRSAAGWLRNKILHKRQETLSTPATQQADLDANAYTPRHALTSEPAAQEAGYRPRHSRPTMQAVAVHNGEKGLYRSTYAAETTQSPSEHMAEVIRLRDAIAAARTRDHRIISPRRSAFRMPADVEAPPIRLRQAANVAQPEPDAYASFKDTLPPPAESLEPQDAPDAVVTDMYPRRLRRIADDERRMAQAS